MVSLEKTAELEIKPVVGDHQLTWRLNVRLEVKQDQVFAFLRELESHLN